MVSRSLLFSLSLAFAAQAFVVAPRGSAATTSSSLPITTSSLAQSTGISVPESTPVTATVSCTTIPAISSSTAVVSTPTNGPSDGPKVLTAVRVVHTVIDVEPYLVDTTVTEVWTQSAAGTSTTEVAEPTEA